MSNSKVKFTKEVTGSGEEIITTYSCTNSKATIYRQSIRHYRDMHEAFHDKAYRVDNSNWIIHRQLANTGDIRKDYFIFNQFESITDAKKWFIENLEVINKFDSQQDIEEYTEFTRYILERAEEMRLRHCPTARPMTQLPVLVEETYLYMKRKQRNG
jgi:hypothetical protein